jgi:hypothetical protein
MPLLPVRHVIAHARDSQLAFAFPGDRVEPANAARLEAGCGGMMAFLV